MRMNLVELVDWLVDIGTYDQPPTYDTDYETPPPQEEQDIEEGTTIKPKLLEEELIKEDDPEEELTEEEDFEEQWAGDEDL